MNALPRPTRFALGVCTVVAILSGCGGSQPSVGTHAVLTPTVSRSGSPAKGVTLSAVPEWAQLSHDAERNGWNQLETKLGVANVAELQNGWLLTKGGEFNSISESGGNLYAYNSNGYLYAINESTGVPIWEYHGEIASSLGVSVRGGRVFFDCQINTTHQGLCAVDAATGKLDWHFTIYRENGKAVSSSPYNGPTVSGSDVVFGESVSLGSSTTGYLVALDTVSGRINWLAGNCGDTGASDCNGIGSNPAAIYNGVVYYGTSGTGTTGFTAGVCAHQLSDGYFLWCYQTGDINTAPSVSGSTVYAEATEASVETLLALNTTSGTLAWSDPVGGCCTNTGPAIANGTVYALFQNGANLAAFKGKTGRRLWLVTNSTGYSPPAVANGVVYHAVGEPGASVEAYDAANGQALWTSSQAGTTTAGPVVVNGVLYVACSDESSGVDKICQYHLPADHARKR
ncbi:MAG: PQQ-binding-like beta-propeller repeat protein [Candidatus Cybelea sp.]